MERSYDVLLDEVKLMRLRVEGKDTAHGSSSQSADADKTSHDNIQASCVIVVLRSTQPPTLSRSACPTKAAGALLRCN